MITEQTAHSRLPPDRTGCQGATLVEALVSLALLSTTAAALAPTLWQLRESGQEVHAATQTLSLLQSAAESLRLDGAWRSGATDAAMDRAETIQLIEEPSPWPQLRSLKLQTAPGQTWPLWIYREHELAIDTATRREPPQRPWP